MRFIDSGWSILVDPTDVYISIRFKVFDSNFGNSQSSFVHHTIHFFFFFQIRCVCSCVYVYVRLVFDSIRLLLQLFLSLSVRYVDIDRTRWWRICIVFCFVFNSSFGIFIANNEARFDCATYVHITTVVFSRQSSRFARFKIFFVFIF